MVAANFRKLLHRALQVVVATWWWNSSRASSSSRAAASRRSICSGESEPRAVRRSTSASNEAAR